MKRIIRSSAVICVILLTSVFSCKKKESEETYKVSQLNKYFEGLRGTPDNISVQAGRDTVVSGTNGSILHFYPNSFKDAAGNIITSGTIYIQLTEAYEPGDMIANRTSTTADNMPLISGGQVNIVATQNGTKVFANVFGIGFKQPGSSGQQMELYYQADNTNADASVTWKMADTTTPGKVSRATQTDSAVITSNNMGVVTTYRFPGFRHLFDSCTSFGWINCDHPAVGKWGSGVDYTVVHVIIPDRSFDNYNTQVFFVFPSINSCENLSFYNDTTNAFGGYDPKPSFPIGEPYKVVVMSFKEDGYYYAEKSGIITSNMDLNITPIPETLGDIKSRLGGL